MRSKVRGAAAGFVAAALFLLPVPGLPRIPGTEAPVTALVGLVLFVVAAVMNLRVAQRADRS